MVTGRFEWLDPDPETAGQRYVRLRARLVTFFEARRAADPDELADRTLDRLDRLAHSRQIPGGADVERYAVGVARNVLREERRFWSRALVRLRMAARSFWPESIDYGCVEFSLSRLGVEDRMFIEAYYPSGDVGSSLPAYRRTLAGRFGPSYDAVKQRASKTIREVREYYRQCLEQKIW